MKVIKCSLCKSPGVTKITCPLNKNAKNPDSKKHPKAKNINKIVYKKYIDKKSPLKENQRKWCRCVLHVAKNNSIRCNRHKGWERKIKKCYNPYTVCASSVKTTTGGKTCSYLFKNKTIPDKELLAYANLYYKKYNIL